MDSNTPVKPTLFFGLRLRHAIALLICLAAILIMAGFFSVSAGKKAAFEAITEQGKALTETLISSAENIIEADNEFVDAGLRQYTAIVADYTRDGFPGNEKALSKLQLDPDIRRVSSVSERNVAASVTNGTSPITVAEIDTWLAGLDIAPDAEVVYDFITVDDQRYFRGYFPYDDKRGIFLLSEWTYGQYGNEKLSLYYLLNQVGREAGVEYIMLQNSEGIVFASKKIASTKPIADDPFLLSAGDSTVSRILDFQDREVLETVRAFKYSEFDGLFRVGLSLYGYRKIADGMKRQVWLVVAALIVIGMLGFGAVVGFQNFDLLKATLQKSDIISRSLLDSLPGPVAAVDQNLKITDINSSARDLFGLKNSNESDYRSLFDGDPFHFEQVLQSKRSASFESDMGMSGRRFFVSATPLIDYDGAAMGAIAIAQDITDTRKLEQMAESRKRLSEMGALAASMAHEIRNPLNAIGLTIQRMKSEIQPVENKEDYDKFLNGLKTEIARLNSIIEKFLTVARSAKPKLVNADISEIISGVVDLFADQAKSKNIRVEWTPVSGISAEIDKDALTQALVNVVKNSIEALKNGGQIEVDLKMQDEKIILSVIDDGPGIEDLSAAMKPFYTTKDGGTGLGLATSASILADHGGELLIESSPGKGCKVSMIIPSTGRTA